MANDIGAWVDELMALDGKPYDDLGEHSKFPDIPKEQMALCTRAIAEPTLQNRTQKWYAEPGFDVWRPLEYTTVLTGVPGT